MIAVQYLNQICQANPIEIGSNSTSDTSHKSEEATTTAKTQLLISSLSLDSVTNTTDEDEILEAADSIVFRPLFVYRQQQAKRRRLYENKAARRKDPPAKPQKSSQRIYYPHGYVYSYPYRYPNAYELYNYSYYKPKRYTSSKYTKRFRRRNSERRPIVWPYWG